MKILVWNINTFGGADEQKNRYYDKAAREWRRKSEREKEAFAKGKKRLDIERRIFQYVRGENPDICLISKFDCQARSAAEDFIMSMEAEGWTEFFPETYKEKEKYFSDNNSLPLYFVRKCLSKKVAPKPTLGKGAWARFNELVIDSRIFIAVHMRDDSSLWKDLLKHAGKLLEGQAPDEKRPDENEPEQKEREVIIAGDFNACSPIDPAGGSTSGRSKEFALLINMGFIDLTPKIKTFSFNHHCQNPARIIRPRRMRNRGLRVSRNMSVT